MQVIGDLFPNGGESYSIEELLYIIRLHICIHLRKIKFIFNEIDKSEFTEENSNGTVLTDYIYSNFYISNNIICDNHSQENKKTLADIVFGRTNFATYIHRTDDLL